MVPGRLQAQASGGSVLLRHHDLIAALRISGVRWQSGRIERGVR